MKLLFDKFQSKLTLSGESFMAIVEIQNIFGLRKTE